MLTIGAVEALAHHASNELKARFLPKMVAGEWTGTMNLTESQAGSDLSAVRTRAEPDGERYRLFGTKIFITWGEHDVAENIIHLVLARLPDAPAGTRGISLFVAPKFLVAADGSLGARNDLLCVSIEHKLGIHGSPTAIMSYGDKEGAIAYLVGEPNRGLEYMFTMMNHARLNVGLEGVAVAEAAYQKAVAYARTRVQGKPIGGSERATIIHHPDVRRMLMDMKARTEAMRALAYCHRRLHGSRPASSRPGRAASQPGPCGVPDAGRQRLVDRDVDPRRLHRHPSAWRDGLCRGNRRRAVFPRCADNHDLRGHDRDSGLGPDRAQARSRQRRQCGGADRRHEGGSWRRSRRPTIPISRRSAPP